MSCEASSAARVRKSNPLYLALAVDAAVAPNRPLGLLLKNYQHALRGRNDVLQTPTSEGLSRVRLRPRLASGSAV